MKRVLLMVCSICLVLACLFGLFACVAGMKDVMNIKEYKQYDTDQALEGVATARDGIKQLQENKDVYLNGVGNQLKDFLRIFVSHWTLIDGSCTNRCRVDTLHRLLELVKVNKFFGCCA